MIPEALYLRQRRVHGHDIAHEAIIGTLKAPRRSVEHYYRWFAKLLRRTGYHDGRISQSHVETRGREVLSPLPHIPPTSRPLWHHAAPDPEASTIAAEVLRQQPAWLLHAVAQGFEPKQVCRVHPTSEWYLDTTQRNGKRALRCRACMRDGVRQRRARACGAGANRG